MTFKYYCRSVERAASTGAKRAYCKLGREYHWNAREDPGAAEHVTTLKLRVLRAYAKDSTLTRARRWSPSSWTSSTRPSGCARTEVWAELEIG
ncbi:MAG: hypothetical protein ACREX4_11195 [Gammaproteobacteria bacterium]